jgi:serine O-acetyltransferase
MLTNNFLEQLLLKHQAAPQFPKTKDVAEAVEKLVLLLFPEHSKQSCCEFETLKENFEKWHAHFLNLLESMQEHLPTHAQVILKDFSDKIQPIYETLCTDIQAIVAGDPAAISEYEIIRTYPGFKAIAYYRIAHELHLLAVPLLPRMITELAHTYTGIDIHPGASIGHHFFIDHGTGIVVGETSHIGNHVKLYQGVTLGALSVSKNMASTKRHPTIADGVVIYSGATILGGETVIGANSVVGGNVWLTESIPANTKIYHQEQVKIK